MTFEKPFEATYKNIPVKPIEKKQKIIKKDTFIPALLIITISSAVVSIGIIVFNFSK